MNRLAPLFVIVAGALWALDGVVLRPELYTLPVFLVVFLESAIISALLTPFFLKRTSEIRELDRGDLIAFLAVALFGGAIGTMAITKAFFYVNYINLSIVVLIQKL